MFGSFLDAITVHTNFAVINTHITYDSTRAVAIIKESDKQSWVIMHNLDTYEKTFSEKISGAYIKLNEVE